MKKTLLSTCVCAMLFAVNAQKSTQPEAVNGADTDPNLVIESGIPSNKALWDIQFSMNSTLESGYNGQAGIAFFNNEFWVSRWASDTLFRFSNTGTLISTFTIAGLSGTRSITTDGTYLYIANNTTTIYRVDAGTAMLAPPHITSSATDNSRFLSYDASLDGGAGGFWTGNFNTDIYAVSMTGAVLTTIPVATHGQGGMYGAAFDNSTAGGPYLWIYSQSGANSTQITALTLPAGTPVAAFNHDTYPDFSAMYSLTSGLAGGLFITTDYSAGATSLVGILQGAPDNVLFVYDVNATSGVLELNSGDKEVVKITDLMGRETDYKTGQALIYIYSDGSTKKVFNLEK